jgi:hypothetical protein
MFILTLLIWLVYDDMITNKSGKNHNIIKKPVIILLPSFTSGQHTNLRPCIFLLTFDQIPIILRKLISRIILTFDKLIAIASWYSVGLFLIVRQDAVVLLFLLLWWFFREHVDDGNVLGEGVLVWEGRGLLLGLGLGLWGDGWGEFALEEVAD